VCFAACLVLNRNSNKTCSKRHSKKEHNAPTPTHKHIRLHSITLMKQKLSQ
jgi:hypothetical protein